MMVVVVVVEAEEAGAEAAGDGEDVDEGVTAHHAIKMERIRMEKRQTETRPRLTAAVACRWAACFKPLLSLVFSGQSMYSRASWDYMLMNFGSYCQVFEGIN